MPEITLRTEFGKSSANDLRVSVQDKTFEHLRITVSPEVRVSAFFDRDELRVEAEYAEIFLGDDSHYVSRVTKIIPGSRARKGITLPGEMKQGEQLTILVARSPR
jgi:hypothetical protein